MSEDAPGAAAPETPQLAAFGALFQSLVGDHIAAAEASDSHKAGRTRFGVTREMLGDWLNRRGPATAAELAAITRETAARLIFERYWRPIGADKLPPEIVPLLLDRALTLGPESAVALMQRAVVDATSAGLPVTGRLDPDTLEAVAAAPVARLAEQILSRRLSNVSRAREGRLLGRKGLVLLARGALFAGRLGLLKR